MSNSRKTANSASRHDKLTALTSLIGEDAARRILSRYVTLHAIGAAPSVDLAAIKGVGISRATLLQAAFRFAALLTRERLPAPYLVKNANDVANLMREDYRFAATEHLHAVLLDLRNQHLRTHLIATGTLNRVSVCAREVFRTAVHFNAAKVALVHNHTSGDLTPSQADIQMTAELKKAGNLLGIELIDHVILGAWSVERRKDFVSLAEEGYLPS